MPFDGDVDDLIRHNCGFVVAPTLPIAHDLLNGVQHRGKEATGFSFFRHDGKIDVVKWRGPVSQVEVEDLMKIFRRERYHTVAGHVRYATRGRKDKILQDAHPHTIGGTFEVSSHNPNLIFERDCQAAIVHNGQVDTELLDFDPNKLKSECDSEALLHHYMNHGYQSLLRKVPGAYTCAIMDGRINQTRVIRDGSGIKPGFRGKVDGMDCFASEDYIFNKEGRNLEGKLRRGTAYSLDSNGRVQVDPVITGRDKRFCMFELAYIAHKLSTLEGANVASVRKSLGRMLAHEYPDIQADYVTYLPRCPEDAAKEYSIASGIPFLDIFYKERGERSFQNSTEEQRGQSIKGNLGIFPESHRFDAEGNPVDLRGKTIVVIDDSIVRGNNSRRARDLLLEAGAKKVIFLSYTPKIGIIGENGMLHGCSYGVDMTPTDNFIVRAPGGLRNRTSQEINIEMGMEVGYASIEGFLGVLNSHGLSRNDICYHCIGGPKPF